MTLFGLLIESDRQAKQSDRTQASYGQPFHDGLLKDIIPFVEANYPVYSDRGRSCTVQEERTTPKPRLRLGGQQIAGQLVTAPRELPVLYTNHRFGP